MKFFMTIEQMSLELTLVLEQSEIALGNIRLRGSRLCQTGKL